MKKLTVGHHVVEWVAKRTNEFGNFGCATGIGLMEWGDIPHSKPGWKMVAGVAYAEWNGVNVVCHIASEGKRWATREYLGTIFDYPYNQLGVKRITVVVGEGNKDSRRFVEHLGFSREANLSSAHPTGDLLVYRMFRNDCVYLREPYALTRPDLLRAAA